VDIRQLGNRIEEQKQMDNKIATEEFQENYGPGRGNRKREKSCKIKKIIKARELMF
jgi:hypothetical protein